jgi:hypothetical protein
MASISQLMAIHTAKMPSGHASALGHLRPTPPISARSAAPYSSVSASA